MLYNRVIPSLLLRDGRLVKGVQFAAWRDAGLPTTTVRAYNAQKADEIMVLDIDASRLGRGPDPQLVSAVAAECEVPLTVGGGIADAAAALACVHGGADKIALNSAPRRRPEVIADCARRLGSQAVVVCVDVVETADGPRLFDHMAGDVVAGRDWLEHCRDLCDHGAGEIRLMAVSREGRRCGFAIELWRQLRSAVRVPIILEGGAGDLDDVERAMAAGVDSVALGTMLVFSDNNLVQVKRHLKNRGHPIRL